MIFGTTLAKYRFWSLKTRVMYQEFQSSWYITFYWNFPELCQHLSDRCHVDFLASVGLREGEAVA